MLKLKHLQFIYYIGFILCFFTTFVIYFIKNTNFNIPVGAVIWIGLPVLLLYEKTTSLLLFYKNLFKYPIAKTYIIMILYVSVSIIVHACLGQYTAPSTFYATKFLRAFCISVGLYFFVPLGVYLKINIKNLTKLFYLCIFLIFIIAIIEYFVKNFNIVPIYKILDFLSNQRYSMYGYMHDGLGDTLRCRALFAEPSELGQFIFITMPFVINFKYIKEPIIKNNIIRFITKKSILFIMIIALIMTESPIYFILCLIELLILHLITYRKYLGVILFFSFIVLSVGAIILNSDTNISDTFLNRIIITKDCLGSFDNLVVYEPSLASRISSYATQLVIFKQHFVFGVGFWNVCGYLGNKLLAISPLPLTQELIMGYFRKSDVVGVNFSLIYTSMAEFGLVGIFFYIIYFYRNLKFLNIIKNKLKNQDYYFILSLLQSCIMVVILGFYNLTIGSMFIPIIFSLVLFTNIYYIRYK